MGAYSLGRLPWTRGNIPSATACSWMDTSRWQRQLASPPAQQAWAHHPMPIASGTLHLLNPPGIYCRLACMGHPSGPAAKSGRAQLFCMCTLALVLYNARVNCQQAQSGILHEWLIQISIQIVHAEDESIEKNSVEESTPNHCRA